VVFAILHAFKVPLRPPKGRALVLRPWPFALMELGNVAGIVFAGRIMSKIERRPFPVYGLPWRSAFERRFWSGALTGIVAFPLLPVAPLPQVDFPTIQVSATAAGASPETMAATVATPLERQFSTIAGLSAMNSTNSLGTTQITLQFELSRDSTTGRWLIEEIIPLQ